MKTSEEMDVIPIGLRGTGTTRIVAHLEIAVVGKQRKSAIIKRNVTLKERKTLSVSYRCKFTMPEK